MHNFIQHYARGIRATGRIAVPAGDARIAFVDGGDVAKAVFQGLFERELTSTSVELTGPIAISFAEAAGSISRALGKEISYCNATEEATRAFMANAKFPAWKIDALLELYASYRRGEAEQTRESINDLTNFDSFIINHREEFR